MRVRVFANPKATAQLEKYFNFLRMNGGTQTNFCSPVQWLPPADTAGAVADLHIYIGEPVRLAVPWARYNVLVAAGEKAQDLVVSSDIDSILDPVSLTGGSKQVLSELRSLLADAGRKGHDAPLPSVTGQGTAPPPKIGVITATGGRPSWWTNMVRNVTEQAWPVSRLEWLIVDNEGDDNLADLVNEFRERVPGLVVRYKSMPPGTTIGAKRNAAARLASADVSVFAVMDDDDHYPANSLSTRASWLSRTGRVTDIVYCSTLPMYDIRKYVSAINVPPLDEPPQYRISEATLLFTRAAWEERPFPDSSMAEGNGFVKGRLERSVEIGPADVIVSFIHNANTSSRRVPADQPPNGCHYGFSDEYFSYLHRIVPSVSDGSTTPVTA
jgi:hypothetical protein